MMNNEDEEAAWLELERRLKRIDTAIAEVSKEALVERPVAWRKKVGNIWHYFDESSPFNLDDCEPLYLRPTK
jgi:hypothetical protein